MNHRIQLGRSGLSVSPICYGTWQLSPRFWGQVPSDDLVAAMRRAFEVGVNFYDTAGAYGDGLAETVLGQAVAVLPRDQIVLATKVYWHFHPDGRRLADLSGKYVVDYCHEALARLKTDYIDLLQLHAFDPFTPLEETTSALDKLRQAGKIRAYGVSNFTVEQFRAARAVGDYSTFQPKYSLLDRATEADLLPYCASQNVGVLVYSPLALGLLTGKFDGSETFTDLRAKNPRFQGQKFKDLAAAVRGLAPVAAKYGLTLTQLMLAATLGNPAIHCAIVGVKNAAQIEESAGAMGKKLDREDFFKIRAAVSE
jgi:aryl-alcohol dehydrogenase-like predicted oxidoreductase